MPGLGERAGISAQFFGQQDATALIGEQRRGAITRFSLIAHEGLIGTLTHGVAGQHLPRRCHRRCVIALFRL